MSKRNHVAGKFEQTRDKYKDLLPNIQHTAKVEHKKSDVKKKVCQLYYSCVYLFHPRGCDVQYQVQLNWMILSFFLIIYAAEIQMGQYSSPASLRGRKKAFFEL